MYIIMIYFDKIMLLKMHASDFDLKEETNLSSNFKCSFLM